MMKKIIYIAFLILLAACTNQELPVSPQDEGRDVEFTFSIKVPEAQAASRSMSSPVIISLYLVVFDAQGFLTQSVAATPVNGWNYSTTTETEFKVTLKQTSEKRIVHFIANYDANAVGYGSESEVIGAMKTSGEADAYWQRIEFPEGINENTAINLMKPVYLVRNYAKISVESKANNFTLSGFAVANVPTQGSVAPYKTNGGGFAEYYSRTNNTPNTYTNLSNTQGYKGFMLSSWMPANATISAFTNTPFYMYEHPYPNDETATYVLVQGRYNSGEETFYKLDLVYKDSETGILKYDILRNFEYAITINSVSDQGYASAEEAAKHPAANNLSASVLTKSLLNISDGTSRLFVSYTDTILVNTNKITLRYKYIPDMNNGATSNATVQFSGQTNGKVIADKLEDETSSGWQPYETDDANGYRSIDIYPQAPGAIPQTQTVTLYAGDLSREVTFHLRQAYELKAVCESKYVEKAMNKEQTIQIIIPDQLPENIFPLTFNIEAKKQSLYPDAAKDYMPVWTGTSIIDGTTRSFGFAKTITYEQYKSLDPTLDGKKQINCHFKTNKADNASSVYVYNKYFNLGSDAFTNEKEVQVYSKINISANKLPSSGLRLFFASNRTVYIYTSDNFADSDMIGDKNGYTFTDNGPTENINITGLNLKETDVLYFRYQDGFEYYHVARITVGDLMGSNPSLNFY